MQGPGETIAVTQQNRFQQRKKVCFNIAAKLNNRNLYECPEFFFSRLSYAYRSLGIQRPGVEVGREINILEKNHNIR